MSLMPEGVKVYFGDSLNKKIWIEQMIEKLFKRNGFRYIELPTYEYFSDIEDNFTEKIKDSMFKFQDRDSGRVVALRPDMTSLLAKLINVKKEKDEFVNKIFYIGDVFRYEKIKSGAYREISQAGMELIGGDKKSSDIETLVLAIELLKELGIKEPKLEIGDINIFNQVINKHDFSEDEILELKKHYSNKDIPALKKFVEDKKCDKLLLDLPLMIGKMEILDKLDFEEAKYLKEILSQFEKLGYGDNYVLDLGLVNEMEYYSGLVIRGFGEKTGDYILTGGRYDELMSREAIGFVINIDMIVEATEEKKDTHRKGILLVGKNIVELYKMRDKFLSEDKIVEINSKKMSQEATVEYAKKRGYKYIYNVENDEKIKVGEAR